MNQLASYVCGGWVRAGTDDVTPLVNPATEDTLATAHGGGFDVDEALAFARDHGGSALRSLTFRQRGGLLRAVSRAVHRARDELLDLAIANGGNTRSDAKLDVDGASSTLAAYADLAETLGDALVLVDGEPTPLGRSARLAGQHLYVARRGVAVHVNAFNFPAWSLCEKAACALLAGMPVVVKPATSTALVAHRIVQLVAGEKLLPEGALSLVCGGAGDLLDRLGAQDVLAFTGSGQTAAALRAGRAFVQASAHINVEADSLNAAVLGPDVEDGSDLARLFVGDVVRDVTQKAGQKCTAIRRALVPSALSKSVVEALRERLGEVRIGDPARSDVAMGPVATAAQLRGVRDGIARLSANARAVCGGAHPVDAAGVAPGKGYFVAATLFEAEDTGAGDAVHRHEVFGPVATVMPYDGAPGQAAQRVAWGGGGLVVSVYSDDRAFVRELVLELAPHHGRVVIATSRTAAQSLPPGMVLPQLVHGGPGRAGGGEELGGKRGLTIYMQRVALQGDRAFVEGLAASTEPTGPTRAPGAPSVAPSVAR